MRPEIEFWIHSLRTEWSWLSHLTSLNLIFQSVNLISKMFFSVLKAVCLGLGSLEIDHETRILRNLIGNPRKLSRETKQWDRKASQSIIDCYRVSGHCGNRSSIPLQNPGRLCSPTLSSRKCNERQTSSFRFSSSHTKKGKKKQVILISIIFSTR